MNKKIAYQTRYVTALCLFFLLAIVLASCSLAEGLNVPDATTPTFTPTTSPTATEELATPTETPPPTETPSPEVNGVITASSMWVRSGPGTRYVMIGGVRFDDEVTLIGRTADSSWLLSEQGWLFGEYVESESDLSVLPVLYDFENEAPTLTPITTTPEAES
jgi:uncharacterized protein YgiM (DUF1202 family)